MNCSACGYWRQDVIVSPTRARLMFVAPGVGGNFNKIQY